MFLSAREEGNTNVNLTDGNGKKIENCISIETETGEALVFVDWDRPDKWPEDWKFGNWVGTGGAMEVVATFKTPITVTTISGIVVQNELQLAVASRFEMLGSRLEHKSRENKQKLEDAFINLWAELGRAKAGIFDN
jgi:hypothetical protein